MVAEFRLANLSPLQVENACFTPSSKKALQSNTNGNGDIKSKSTLAALERRIAAQELRIATLENKLNKFRLASPNCENLSTVSNVYGSPGSPFASICQSFSVASDEEHVRFELKVPTQRLRSVLLETPLSPSPSAPNLQQTRPKEPIDHLSGENVFSPSNSVSSHGVNAYLSDDLSAFESLLDSSKAKLAKENIEHPSEETLIEGIGSASEIIRHCPHTETTQQANEQPGIPVEPMSMAVSPKSQPWDGSLNWTLTSPFSDPDDEMNTLRAQPPISQSLSLFQHGLVYVPREIDHDVYRTVALTHLPLDADLRTLFAGIRGGAVFAAHLMDMGREAGYKMGIVTFVEEAAAKAYVEFAATDGVYFNGHRARVVPFKTPTYPISPSMEREVLAKSQTRCLVVRGVKDSERFTEVAKCLKKTLPMYFDLGDMMVENEGETELHIRLNSIQAARHAMIILRHFWKLSQCVVEYAPDPCSQALPRSDEE